MKLKTPSFGSNLTSELTCDLWQVAQFLFLNVCGTTLGSPAQERRWGTRMRCGGRPSCGLQRSDNTCVSWAWTGHPSGRSRARGSPVTVACVTWVSASSQERTLPGTFGPTSDTHGITSGPLFPEDLAPHERDFHSAAWSQNPWSDSDPQWPVGRSSSPLCCQVNHSAEPLPSCPSWQTDQCSLMLGFILTAKCQTLERGRSYICGKRRLENERGVLQPCCGRHPRTY